MVEGVKSKNGKTEADNLRAVQVLPDQAKTKTGVNAIWRFYSTESHEWKWQQLAMDGTVLEHSKAGYTTYEACMANASQHGYVFGPALSTKPPRKPAKPKRSYTLITKK